MDAGGTWQPTTITAETITANKVVQMLKGLWSNLANGQVGELAYAA